MLIWLIIVCICIYLFFGRKKNIVRQEQQTIDIEGEIVEEDYSCPQCGKKVKDDFIICPYCGLTLRQKCENCGAAVKREWEKCPYCETTVKTKR